MVGRRSERGRKLRIVGELHEAARGLATPTVAPPARVPLVEEPAAPLLVAGIALALCGLLNVPEVRADGRHRAFPVCCGVFPHTRRLSLERVGGVGRWRCDGCGGGGGGG